MCSAPKISARLDSIVMDELKKRKENPRSEPQVLVLYCVQMQTLTLSLRISRIGFRRGVVHTLGRTPTEILLGP